MTNTDAYTAARHRAEAKYHFYVHLAVYGAVMVLLLAINLFSFGGVVWVIWPMLGWGIAIAIHAVRVFLMADETTIVDRMTERELRHSGH